MGEVEQDLVQAWEKAEADSFAAGIDCVQTTVTSGEMATLLEDGASGLAAALESARPGSWSRGEAFGT